MATAIFRTPTMFGFGMLPCLPNVLLLEGNNILVYTYLVVCIKLYIPTTEMLFFVVQVTYSYWCYQGNMSDAAYKAMICQLHIILKKWLRWKH